MFNSIPISVSDDESDDLTGKMRVRVRRKRRKLGFRGKNEFLRRMFRMLLKWWTVLLFLSAVGLLLFEASRMTAKPNDSNVGVQPDHIVKEKSEGNLNRLDPTTRILNGIRQPCLKLLPPEALQHLDLPLRGGPNSPVKRVIYKSDLDASYIGGDATMFQRNKNATRFNLFTGNQTLYEREQSFKVNETAVVHCGFYSEKGGFKISDEDKSYMRTCKVVVSTCTFGGGDDLYQPIGMSEASLRKVCYVAFWDDVTLATQEADGKRIGEDRMIGEWRIVVVKDLPFTDQRLNGKIPKMLTHRLFPQARYSIWVDSKSQFRRDPLGVLEALLWRTNSVLAISEHGARSSVYDEGKAVVKKNKATPEEVEIQLSQYRRDGFPDEKRFNGKKEPMHLGFSWCLLFVAKAVVLEGCQLLPRSLANEILIFAALSEASVIVRELTPLTNLFMCLWFNEVVRFTSRDQLSFPYVLRQLNVKNINMFPVCTRKDLYWGCMVHLQFDMGGKGNELSVIFYTEKSKEGVPLLQLNPEDGFASFASAHVTDLTKVEKLMYVKGEALSHKQVHRLSMER
ncbi:Protein of unknown function DUF616 [Macleaya cordata]|uniref:TOD1/MUCI70 glycosyltransferase-like domain-containing protein n=1 Tax=Macleaya cordata TaxID=56857 RepID=A0A200Q423_MACCD|nr:Protein of unknown function DUF616 [Macleaya cordata]